MSDDIGEVLKDQAFTIFTPKTRALKLITEDPPNADYPDPCDWDKSVESRKNTCEDQHPLRLRCDQLSASFSTTRLMTSRSVAVVDPK